ncbi:MAG: pentapeptide repeat-containing protein, partial [Alphaproteobacteria bacterium]|nr:pentapeptide repeat-containing protein [Alphaproteobacteria bacterium]
DAILRGARLDGANLIDANLSEAVLDDACLQGASLQNACFYGASLRRACFTDAAFGATDIGGARIDGAIFSTLSALLLNFRSCETMEACRFIGPAEETSVFSQPPIVISGLPDIIAFIGPHIKIGQKEYFCHKKMLTEEK